jgi:hypothetical protein
MVWYEKIKKIVESPASIELKIYRNKVRDNLLKELEKKRKEMISHGRFPYKGGWLTHDEIILAIEKEKKEKFTRLVLLIFIYFLLFVTSLILGFIVFRSAG